MFDTVMQHAVMKENALICIVQKSFIRSHVILFCNNHYDDDEGSISALVKMITLCLQINKAIINNN